MNLNNMKTFTIITPVYNSQSYIEKCLLSVINQKYNLNLVQHILINDGSNGASQARSMRIYASPTYAPTPPSTA